MMKKYVKYLFAAMLLGSSTIPAFAEPFSSLVAFSGALTDTGNMASEKGSYPAPFYKNRNSNGPLAIDVMARRLGLKSDASMHLVGKSGGTNFAVSDALAGGHGPHDLPAQIDAFLARNGGKADPNALYFVFIGGNDVVLASMTPDNAKAKQISDAAVAGIEIGIKRLVDAGARYIMAPDFIDIGLAPVYGKFGPQARARATQLSEQYNKDFDAMLDRIDNKSFVLIRWSFDGFVNKMMKNADKAGFINTADSCQAYLKDKKCDYDKFVFFNEEYPTAKVHDLLGNALALAVLMRS